MSDFKIKSCQKCFQTGITECLHLMSDEEKEFLVKLEVLRQEERQDLMEQLKKASQTGDPKFDELKLKFSINLDKSKETLRKVIMSLSNKDENN